MNAPTLPLAAPGPRVVRLCGLTLSGAWIVAWWSWGIQVLPLVGHAGVLPLDAGCTGPVGLAPSATFACALAPWLAPPFGDAVLLCAVTLGLLSATAAALGLWVRPMLVATLLPYVAFLAAAPSFFPSIGDKLLVEVTALVVLLPRERAAPWGMFLARAVLIKLYWGMGIAQWRVHGNAWQRGTALGDFLQNAVLPTRSGWYVAHLPAPVLAAATRLALLMELCVPVLAFGTRPLRLAAALGLTALQLAVANLVNDGLFAFAATALHLLLLDDADVVAAVTDVTALWPWLGRALNGLLSPLPAPQPVRHGRAADGAVAAVLGAWLSVSACALAVDLHVGPSWLGPLTSWHGGWTYVHAGAPSVGRTEPVFEVREVREAQSATPQGAGGGAQADTELGGAGTWRTVELWHEPGDPWRAPRLVLPHVPRLDVALSVAGRSRASADAQRLVHAFAAQLCRPSEGLSRLLRPAPPARVVAVRWHYDGYSFADWTAHHQTGAWWTRAQLADGEQLVCAAPRAGEVAAGSHAASHVAFGAASGAASGAAFNATSDVSGDAAPGTEKTRAP